ncbi:2-oxo-4-hydroxy-4-carboxy-5-ureidoimidazoline decarboxylase [Candidatus Entotheonella palauensis]|uniref:2-oxo-4-hydroxy-4-carboxy-5-ureidoimidazoline decarboxylase n=1 Tax=Candidatus Entotheonella palauensis TaxID=93172 RepID=UPI000B7CB895|nr:2-oxo-4-hydroxy-4-carboxy-5-ureidoimidazoline decarboxylase [Candidatus Entotheonella palauensis]
MDQSIDVVNNMERTALQTLLARCCGATRWVSGMIDQRPFTDWPHLQQVADDIWRTLAPADWREAFAQHPKIGDLDSLRAKFASTESWSEREQAGVQDATEAVLQGLAQGNRDYERKFGYLFIVCATGKSATEMLELLWQRLPNDPPDELPIAAEEQRRIMQIRLETWRRELEADDPTPWPHHGETPNR